MVRNMFQVNNKNTRTTTMTSVSIDDFELVNVSWLGTYENLYPWYNTDTDYINWGKS